MALQIRKSVGVAACSLMVAACGGGGGNGGVGSTPPPPAAVNSYARFGALTGEQKLDTSGYVIAADDTRVKSASATVTDAVTITFQPASGTYIVKTPFAGSTSYGLADVATGQGFAGDGFTYFFKNKVVNGTSVDSRVALYKPQGGSGQAVPLTYTTLLLAVEQTTPGGFSTVDLSLTYGGFATAVADMPKSGSATYTGPAFGQYWLNAAGQRELLDGSLSVTANFASGGVDTRILLNRFGYSTLTLSGTGTISSNLFEGALTGKGYGAADLSGRFAGQFMGPGAAELGLRFDVTDGSAAIVGVGGARK